MRYYNITMLFKHTAFFLFVITFTTGCVDIDILGANIAQLPGGYSLVKNEFGMYDLRAREEKDYVPGSIVQCGWNDKHIIAWINGGMLDKGGWIVIDIAGKKVKYDITEEYIHELANNERISIRNVSGAWTYAKNDAHKNGDSK